MTELSRHTANLVAGGTSIACTVVAETVDAHAASGEQIGTATLFAYTREDAAPDRPLVIVFNGGPGSASGWLHLSGLATHTASVPDDLTAGATGVLGPLESRTSILDLADLLFVDPVGTGYGRPNEGVDPANVFGIDADAAYFADLVAGWLARNRRISSPLYVLGESYGTIRAVALAEKLASSELCLPVRGIVLLGQALNLQETRSRPTNTTAYVARLPLFAAVAAYHGKLGDGVDIDALVDRAYAFGIDVLAPALLRGSRLPDTELRNVADALAELTSIPATEWIRRRLRMDADEFRTELLRDTSRVLGVYDARYTGAGWDGARGFLPLEPSLDTLGPAFRIALERYLSENLAISAEGVSYRQLDTSAGAGWSWTTADSSVPYGTPSPFDIFDYPATLGVYLRKNPATHLFVGTGLYDTLTTVGAAELLVAMNDLPPERVHLRRYHAGHMMYSDPASARAMSNDLRAFITLSA